MTLSRRRAGSALTEGACVSTVALGRVCHDADSVAERLEPHTFRLEIDWHVLAVVENHEAPSIPEDDHMAGCAVRACLGSIILHGGLGSDFINGIHRQPIRFLHAHRPRLGWVHSMSHLRAAARRDRPHWKRAETCVA